MKDGKHGYINVKNESIIPFSYDFADDFKNGIARVQKGGKFGWIDVTGKVSIPLQYTNAFNFGDGLAPVRNDEGKWGYINPQGEFVLCRHVCPMQNLSIMVKHL